VTEDASAAAPSRSDEELVRAAREGDQSAFHELHSRYYQGIYAVALRWLRDESLARDAVQETFCDAFANLGRFRGRAKFSTWLYRLSRNRLAKVARTQHRTSAERPGFDLDQLTADAHTEAPARSPEEALDARNAYLALLAAIHKLPLEQAVVFDLKFIIGLPTAELCRVLGLDEEAVWARISRGRRKLRELLGHDKEDTEG
jgi:RNA polymerase sigma-70 factor (ECF subfamily)